jgi:hypothetical protein
MMLHCDYCGCLFFEMVKVPSSAFYIEEQRLISMNDYINLCKNCLLQKENEGQ